MPCPQNYMKVNYGGWAACERCVTTPPGCAAAVLDRHIEKNGGTTMRTLLQTNDWQGRCTYQGYSWRAREVEALLRNGTRVCGEAHTSVRNFWSDVQYLKSIRLNTAGGCSSVKVVLRIREPFSFYTSWFLWPAAMDGRQPMNASTLPCDLQSLILIYGWNPYRTCHAFSEEERKRVDDILKLADLVGPMGRFDDFAMLAARLAGGWMSSTHIRLQNAHVPSSDPTRFRDAAGLCGESDPQLPRCRSLVRRLAPADHYLYDRAVALFDRSMEAARSDLGPEDVAAHHEAADARSLLARWTRKCLRRRSCMKNETERALYQSPKCGQGRIDVTPGRRTRKKVYNHFRTSRMCKGQTTGRDRRRLRSEQATERTSSLGDV